MKQRTWFSLAILFLFLCARREHPEHPKENLKPKQFSVADLEKAIKKNIAEQSKATNGIFEIYDPELKKTWKLTLVRVHTDRLSKVGPGMYFACVDMKDPSGKTIDVDFFLRPKNGKLEMSDVTVHKVEGKPRYNWKEEKGFWKRVPVGSSVTEQR